MSNLTISTSLPVTRNQTLTILLVAGTALAITAVALACIFIPPVGMALGGTFVAAATFSIAPIAASSVLFFVVAGAVFYLHRPAHKPKTAKRAAPLVTRPAAPPLTKARTPKARTPKARTPAKEARTPAPRPAPPSFRPSATRPTTPETASTASRVAKAALPAPSTFPATVPAAPTPAAPKAPRFEKPPTLPEGTMLPQFPDAPVRANDDNRISGGCYNILFKQTADPRSAFATGMGYTLHNGVLHENSPDRYKLVAENIRRANLDFWCLSELTDGSAEKIVQELNKDEDAYDLVWKKHDDTVKNPHGVGVLFKKRKFTLIDSQSQTLKYTIGEVQKPRTDVAVDLEYVAGKVIRVVATHMHDPRDWEDDNKTQHATKLVDFALEAKGRRDLIVIGGDMNQDQYGDHPGRGKTASTVVNMASRVFQYFATNYFLPSHTATKESYSELHKAADGTITHAENRLIDWMFNFTNCLTNNHSLATPIQLDNLEILASDHLPQAAYYTI